MKVTLEVEVSEEALALAKKKVNADFNPDNNDKVSEMKNIAAVFTAVCEDNKKDENGNPRCGEALRRVALAQTYIETGTMYAVKSNFSCPEPEKAAE